MRRICSGGPNARRSLDHHRYLKERVTFSVKFLKKINRGAAIMLTLALAVTVYLIAAAAADDAQKPGVQKTCEAFLKDYTAFSMLPEKYRGGGTAADLQAFNDYVASVEKTMSAHYVKKPEKLSQAGTEGLKNSLAAQFSGNVVLNGLEKNILSFDSFVFDGDFVTVDIRSEIKYSSQSPKGEGLMQMQTEVTDTLLLQKTEDGWRLVSARIADVYNYYGMEPGRIEKEKAIQMHIE